MSSLSILNSDARPHAASPLFTRLPAELRLMIYAFVFMGCQATVWFDAEFGEYREAWGKWEPPQGRRRKRVARDGHSCYEHSGGGGFALLATCRLVYIEAFRPYWSQAALRVTRDIRTWRLGCPLQTVCARLAPEIKVNLRHLRNTKLPRLGKDVPADDDANWASTILAEHFPRLVTCAFLCGPFPGQTDSDNLASSYWGLGPLRLKDGDSPEASLERRFGIPRSCCVVFLSMARGISPLDCPSNYEDRVSPIQLR